MPSPLNLTADELLIIENCARPIPVQDRDRFLRDVADRLAEFRELGPGLVSRVAREAQRRVFRPPDLNHDDRPSKYGKQ
jgi:hypothetical protein